MMPLQVPLTSAACSDQTRERCDDQNANQQLNPRRPGAVLQHRSACLRKRSARQKDAYSRKQLHAVVSFLPNSILIDVCRGVCKNTAETAQHFRTHVAKRDRHVIAKLDKVATDTSWQGQIDVGKSAFAVRADMFFPSNQDDYVAVQHEIAMTCLRLFGENALKFVFLSRKSA